MSALVLPRWLERVLCPSLPTPHHMDGGAWHTVTINCHQLSCSMAGDHYLFPFDVLASLLKKKVGAQNDRASWSIRLSLVFPLPSFCALFKLKLLFSSKMNDSERKKKKPPRVEKW